MRLPQSIPTGRLSELTSRDDAGLIAYTLIGLIGEDAVLRRFNSRTALIAFCKPGSRMHALVKDSVAPSMLINPNTQRAA